MLKEQKLRLKNEYHVIDLKLMDEYIEHTFSELNKRKIKVPTEDIDVIVDLLIENCRNLPATMDWINAIALYYDKRLSFKDDREYINFCEWSHNKRKKEGHDKVFSQKQFNEELNAFMDDVEKSIENKELLSRDFLVFCFIRNKNVKDFDTKKEV